MVRRKNRKGIAMASTPITRAFLDQIPKTDLHLHLDGSLRIPTLIELAREAKIRLPSETEEGLRELVFKEQYTDLPDYLKGFALILPVMQTPEQLERIAYELAEDNIRENVRYIEVRYAPQQHVREGFPMREVVASVDRGLARAAKAHNGSAAVKEGRDLPFHYGIIVCAMRFFTPQMSSCYAEFFRVMPYARPRDVFAAASLETVRAGVALAEEGLPVVGFDLAGAEYGYPAGDHKAAFDHAQMHFMRRTVHAGEAFGPESIFQALAQCHADRIGHGTFLFDADKVTDPSIADPEEYVGKLVDTIAKRRITLEVCPTSNLQTIPSIHSVAEHPVRKMVENELSVSICSDNRLMSTTCPAKELEKVCTEIGLTRRQLRNIVLAGFKGAFFPGSYKEKRALVREVIKRYAALEVEHFGDAILV